MTPIYDLSKIRFATDPKTFSRAIDLYERGKVTKVDEIGGEYFATVLGTEPYTVSISTRHYKQGNCSCYLGKKGAFCKHRAALALHAVMGWEPLNAIDKRTDNHSINRRRREELIQERLTEIKMSITTSLKYIKPYNGPSRIWFANQDSLSEGCNRLSAIVSDLPVNRQATELLLNLLLRLDKKLTTGGVDDSNGIVGGFMTDIVEVIKEFTQIDPNCINPLKSLNGKQTCFGWEEPLIHIFDKNIT